MSNGLIPIHTGQVPGGDIRSMIRCCMAAFTPETARPSLFKIALLWEFMSVLTLATSLRASMGPAEAISGTNSVHPQLRLARRRQ